MFDPQVIFCRLAEPSEQSQTENSFAALLGQSRTKQNIFSFRRKNRACENQEKQKRHHKTYIISTCFMGLHSYSSIIFAACRRKKTEGTQIMKLTQYSDLGLRLLMYLALRKGESATIQEVSDRFAVSKNHMVKISHQLTKSGLIESTRGRNGGVRLARLPESINVEQALRATEENFDLVECFGAAKNHCVITGICKLRSVLDAALEAFFEVLREVSLADLVKNSKAIEKYLLPLQQVAEVKFHARSIKPARTRSKV
jgi:Rrf2 family nitric oxide-sensitive transcriptional repressor